MNSEPIALKEWAVAIKALEEGTQILIMRKGGIVEETKDFRIKSPSFYLFPTYEHQKKELLKDTYSSYLDETLRGWSPDDATIKISSFATVVEDIEITDLQQLHLLHSFHIWTEHFAEERLKWKRKNPLHVLVLRIYKLDAPLEIPITPAYLGCKSWIRLDGEWQEPSRIPVINDDEFEARWNALKQALK